MTKPALSRDQLESCLRVERLTVGKQLIADKRDMRMLAARIRLSEERLEEINHAEGLLAGMNIHRLNTTAARLFGAGTIIGNNQGE